MYNKFSVCVLLKIAEMEDLLLVKDCHESLTPYTMQTTAKSFLKFLINSKGPCFDIPLCLNSKQ